MIYNFKGEDAENYGVDEAIMLYNIEFWIIKNIANEKNFYDERYWTYCSRTALTKIFPFWTERRIRTILENLVTKRAIIKGSYNKDARDRTSWYALADISRQNRLLNDRNRQMQMTKTADEYDKNRRPLPDIIPDNNILNTKKENNKKKKSFSFEFVDESAREVMMEWLKYRSEIGKPYKSDNSVKRCYENLLKLSNGDVGVMKKIVDQSISNAWQGLFPLKNYGVKQCPVDNYW